MKRRVRALALLLCFGTLFAAGCGREAPPAAARSDMEYIFVHGLSGWGSYDDAYRQMPYWGMLGGDLMKYLQKQGFSCHAASVSPEGSAWDRACELYAQLTGTVTDYGPVHSQRCGHERFGPDFTGRPLIPDWDSGKKLVLLGHSFGGATIRLFSAILAEGSAEELASGASDLSPFFLGGQGHRLHALVTLAAPTNGTTAYDLYRDPDFDPESVEVSGWDDLWGNFFNRRPRSEPDGRSEEDSAAFDMHIDNALAMNARIPTLPGTYYFAVPCSATEAAEAGGQQPVRSMMEAMFRRSSARMGAYTGRTADGFLLDETWQENDGLVNTVSAMAPLGAPSAPYDPEDLRPGIWQVMPVIRGDHMYLQGGLLKKTDIRPFYLELLEAIDALPPGKN